MSGACHLEFTPLTLFRSAGFASRGLDARTNPLPESIRTLSCPRRRRPVQLHLGLDICQERPKDPPVSLEVVLRARSDEGQTLISERARTPPYLWRLNLSPESRLVSFIKRNEVAHKVERDQIFVFLEKRTHCR